MHIVLCTALAQDGTQPTVPLFLFYTGKGVRVQRGEFTFLPCDLCCPESLAPGTLILGPLNPDSPPSISPEASIISDKAGGQLPKPGAGPRLCLSSRSPQVFPWHNQERISQSLWCFSPYLVGFPVTPPKSRTSQPDALSSCDKGSQTLQCLTLEPPTRRPTCPCHQLAVSPEAQVNMY